MCNTSTTAAGRGMCLRKKAQRLKSCSSPPQSRDQWSRFLSHCRHERAQRLQILAEDGAIEVLKPRLELRLTDEALAGVGAEPAALIVESGDDFMDLVGRRNLLAVSCPLPP